jgi:hypothetical protein
MNTLFMFLFFVLLHAASAFAFDEPGGLQMLRLGEDVRNTLPKCTSLTREEKSQKSCWRQHDVWVADESKLAIQNIKIGEIRLEVAVEQIDDLLERIEATFPGTRFDEMLSAMTERFGKPTTSASMTYQNAFGASFQHPVHAWTGKHVNIVLSKLPLNIRDTIGSLDYKSAKYLTKEAKEKEKKKSATAKDF